MMKKLLIILLSFPLFTIAQQSFSIAQDTFDINGVNTKVGPAAFMWDLSNAKFEVPKGSGKHSVFAHEYWIGGIDDGGQLRVAAQTYRQSGLSDFWTGPVSDSIYHNDIDMAGWDRVWKIDKTEIDNHIVNYSNGTYVMPEAIENWPAHGDVSKGQSPNLAPFVDVDNDGNYIPLNGDYPEIKGDQAIYIIRNDVGDIHTHFDGEKMGIEQHIMFYGYRCDNHPELNNTLFVSMKIYNGGIHNLHDVYVGTYTDVDLGFWIDDYVGCNVPLNLGYVYNGDNDDEGPNGYGFNPPAQGIVYLNNEMSKFVYYWSDNTIMGNPGTDIDIYNFLQGRWKNGQSMMYGGNSMGQGPGAINDSCSYFFPGTTDPAFPGQDWSETTAGNIPADRRFMQSHGPISLNSDESFTLDYAFVFAWDSTNTNGGSVPLLFNYTQNIQDFYDGILTIPCSNINAVNDVSDLSKGRLVKIIDVLGREIKALKNTPLFFIYDDGTVEKRIIIE
jgi:hypothetical protein